MNKKKRRRKNNERKTEEESQMERRLELSLLRFAIDWGESDWLPDGRRFELRSSSAVIVRSNRHILSMKRKEEANDYYEQKYWIRSVHVPERMGELIGGK